MNDETKNTYSTFQKTIYFILLPITYTIILFLILMSVFSNGGNNFSNSLLGLGQQANSLVHKYILKPSPTLDTNQPAGINDTSTTTQQSQTITANNLKIDQMQNDIKQKDDANQTLQNQIKALNDQLSNKQTTEEELKKKSVDLAQEYIKMQPKQAATILGKMNLNDAELALFSMSIPQRSAILEKMDAKNAGDLSIALKDFTLSKDTELASLQTKIKDLMSNKQSMDQLISTYTQMAPQNAAKLIEELMKTDEKKALLIMSQLPPNQNALILSAMSSDKTNPDAITQAVNITKNLTK